MPNPFKHEPSLAELEETNERLDTELSVAQKRAAIARLKERGLTPKHFGNTASSGTWQRIVSWLKSH